MAKRTFGSILWHQLVTELGLTAVILVSIGCFVAIALVKDWAEDRICGDATPPSATQPAEGLPPKKQPDNGQRKSGRKQPSVPINAPKTASRKERRGRKD